MNGIQKSELKKNHKGFTHDNIIEVYNILELDIIHITKLLDNLYGILIRQTLFTNVNHDGM